LNVVSATRLPVPKPLDWITSATPGLRVRRRALYTRATWRIGGSTPATPKPGVVHGQVAGATLGPHHRRLAITFTSVPLGLVVLVMVRHAGVVRPGPTALLAALSAAAVSAAAVSIFHGQETALMGLLWHVGAVTMLSVTSWLMGNQLFAWIGYARR